MEVGREEEVVVVGRKMREEVVDVMRIFSELGTKYFLNADLAGALVQVEQQPKIEGARKNGLILEGNDIWQ